MYGWEQSVLVQHYLEQGLSKTAIAEAVGVSRRTLHYWLTSGKLEGGEALPPARDEAEPQHAYHRRAAGGVSGTQCGSAVRRSPCRGVRRQPHAAERLRAPGPAAAPGGRGGAVRDDLCPTWLKLRERRAGHLPALASRFRVSFFTAPPRPPKTSPALPHRARARPSLSAVQAACPRTAPGTHDL